MYFIPPVVTNRLFSQARRRKDSPLISAGGRLNSENSPVPLKYATLLGQINVRCRESTERVISQSALLLAARAAGRAYTQTFPSNNCESTNWSGGRFSTGTVAVDWFPRIPRFRRGVRKQPKAQNTSLLTHIIHYTTLYNLVNKSHRNSECLGILLCFLHIYINNITTLFTNRECELLEQTLKHDLQFLILTLTRHYVTA